jgi:hypothetical protein
VRRDTVAEVVQASRVREVHLRGAHRVKGAWRIARSGNASGDRSSR